VWAIPAGVDMLVMFYNQDLFDQYDVPYPEVGWTWGDFLDTALLAAALPLSPGLLWKVQCCPPPGWSSLEEESGRYSGERSTRSSVGALHPKRQ